MNLKSLTISNIAAGLRQKEYSVEELTVAYLKAINQDRYNCFITVNDEQALIQAREADKLISQGKATLLTGVPIAIKDILTTAGIRTTAGSKMLQNYLPPYNATAVQKLLDQGMIILGKTNCDEFAMGASNENSAYGQVLNPHDPTRVSGGSSGGSAAAVAADLAPVALGTDTGGSVRQPASFCGVVGLKPTYGRVSRHGLMAMASSFDQVGIFANTVEDAAILLHYIAGQDRWDSTSSMVEVADYFQATTRPLTKLTIGLPKQYFQSGIDPEVRDKLDSAVKILTDAGVNFKSVDLPSTDYALATYYVMVPAEVSSNMARYDGVRYGLSLPAPSLIESYKKSRSLGFGTEVRRRIMLGTFALSSGYYQAYYAKAQKVREIIKQDFNRVFKDVDLLLTPTTPSTAFKLGEKSDPLQMYLADVFTVAANCAGIPGISLPAGKIGNLPVGLQLMAPVWQESKLLNLAYHWQQHRDQK